MRLGNSGGGTWQRGEESHGRARAVGMPQGDVWMMPEQEVVRVSCGIYGERRRQSREKTERKNKGNFPKDLCTNSENTGT
jgi:hypothetical protein